MLEWTAVGLLAIGTLPFLSTNGAGYVTGLGGWLAIVTACLVMTSVGLSAAIAGIAPSTSGGPRGALTVVATLAVATVAAWSLWLTIGPPAIGTLTEATPLLVDPPIAALVAVLFLRRSDRLAVAAFALATIVTVIVIARFVAAVGQTYSV